MATKTRPEDFEPTKFKDGFLPALVAEFWRQLAILEPLQAIAVASELQKRAVNRIEKDGKA
jgi:hypothetical protein